MGVKHSKNDTRDVYPATFAYICQDIERKCMIVIKESFEKRGYISGTLIYDGLHVGNDKGEISESTLMEIEKEVLLKTSYPMKITIKSMYNSEDDELLIMSEEDEKLNKIRQQRLYANVKEKFEDQHFKCLKDGLFYVFSVDPENGCKTITSTKREQIKTTYEHIKCLIIKVTEDGIEKE